MFNTKNNRNEFEWLNCGKIGFLKFHKRCTLTLKTGALYMKDWICVTNEQLKNSPNISITVLFCIFFQNVIAILPHLHINYALCERVILWIYSSRLHFGKVGFLAHLVMSLCNHALSVVWWCHLCRWHQHRWHHLCTALPVTALIIETWYLGNICIYTPSMCTWNIRSMWYVFFKWQPF